MCPRDTLRLEDSRATGRAPPSRAGSLALIGGKQQRTRASFLQPLFRPTLHLQSRKRFLGQIFTHYLRSVTIHTSATNMAPKDYMAEKGELVNIQFLALTEL